MLSLAFSWILARPLWHSICGRQCANTWLANSGLLIAWEEPARRNTVDNRAMWEDTETQEIDMGILGCVLTQLHPCSLKHSPPARKDLGFQNLSPTCFFSSSSFFFFYIYLFIWLCWVLTATLRIFCCFSLVAAHWFSCSMACGILLPQPGMQTVSPALEGGFLTTGPLGKSL